MKLNKILAGAILACLILTACSSENGEDASSDVTSYSLLFMPDYTASSETDSLESGLDVSGITGSVASGSETTASLPDDGSTQVVSAETVSAAGAVGSGKEALDIIKDRVIPIRFRNVPTFTYEEREGGTGRYVGELKTTTPNGETTATVTLTVTGETAEFYRVVYSSTTQSEVGGREITDTIAGYQVYKDGRVKDATLEEFIAIKK